MNLLEGHATTCCVSLTALALAITLLASLALLGPPPLSVAVASLASSLLEGFTSPPTPSMSATAAVAAAAAAALRLPATPLTVTASAPPPAPLTTSAPAAAAASFSRVSPRSAVAPPLMPMVSTTASLMQSPQLRPAAAGGLVGVAVAPLAPAAVMVGATPTPAAITAGTTASYYGGAPTAVGGVTVVPSPSKPARPALQQLQQQQQQHQQMQRMLAAQQQQRQQQHAAGVMPYWGVYPGPSTGGVVMVASTRRQVHHSVPQPPAQQQPQYR